MAGISQGTLQVLLSEPGSPCPPRTTNRQLRHIIHVSTILWASAVISWVSDRLFCSFWQRIHFFYLHSIW